MHIQTFYDECTATFTYVIVDEVNRKCGIVDSVLTYDPSTARTSTVNADQVIDYIQRENLENQWILETHVHADHITAAHYLKQQVGGNIAIGSGIREVLSVWVPIFETEADTQTDGSQFDQLFNEGDSFAIGDLKVTVWHTPGHTPACVSYLVENHIFVGDTLFAPHLGTARCDFPGGSAATLYRTIQRFFTLPEATVMHLGHDYPEAGQQPVATVTLANTKKNNVHISPHTTMADYIAKREARDATLAVPKLLLPALQANLRNGQFGTTSPNGQQFIKIPINAI